MYAATDIVTASVEEIRTAIVRQLGTCRVAVLNDPGTARDFHDGVAPVVTRIVSEAKSELSERVCGDAESTGYYGGDLDDTLTCFRAEVTRLNAARRAAGIESTDDLDRAIEALKTEISCLRSRETQLLEANNAELERRRQAERERDNMRATWERAWAEPTAEEYQERIRGLLVWLGTAETLISDYRRALLAITKSEESDLGEFSRWVGQTCEQALKDGQSLEQKLFPPRKHQPFEYDPEPRQVCAVKCLHERADEDGICRRCGADCRGIHGL